jgi:hypothetical protein
MITLDVLDDKLIDSYVNIFRKMRRDNIGIYGTNNFNYPVSFKELTGYDLIPLDGLWGITFQDEKELFAFILKWG